MTRQELIEVRKAIVNLQEEIQHPGKPASRGQDFKGDARKALAVLDRALAGADR